MNQQQRKYMKQRVTEMVASKLSGIKKECRIEARYLTPEEAVQAILDGNFTVDPSRSGYSWYTQIVFNDEVKAGVTEDYQDRVDNLNALQVKALDEIMLAGEDTAIAALTSLKESLEDV